MTTSSTATSSSAHASADALAPPSALSHVPSPGIAPASPQYVATADAIKLAPELNSSITTILRSSDPLDAQEFSSVEYINKIFPNEHSLKSVDQVLIRLQAKAKQVQEELRELTRAQTDGGQKGQEEVEAAKRGIEQLFFKIKEIKEKATQSEQMVHEITRDIKSLDYAKRHLTLSITTLKRLQMLVTAVDQLRVMAQRKQYRESSQLLEAVLQLIQYFKTYQNVRQIAELTDSVATLQADLERDIVKDFENAFTPEGILIGNVSQLASACLVIDILGEDVRLDLVEWYCNLQLRAYRSVFKSSEEVSQLDNTSRRYAWLKRLLKIHDDEHALIFPPAWDVSKVLCLRFCQTTRADLMDILAKTASQVGVPLLLQVLQLTLEFETQLENRFIRTDVDYAVSEEPEPAGFLESISPCFEPYLSLYIDAEDRTLEDKIRQFKAQELDPEDDPSNTVIQSSTELFMYYKSALTNCAKLSRKKPFLDLCRLFGKWLRVYADEVLLGKLPKPSDKKPVNKLYIRSICIILNTADYSLTTTNQLEERLWANIDPEYVDQVSLEAERQSFLNIISVCTRTLVQSIETNIESALSAMTKVPWATLETVGDQSEYVTTIQQTLRTNVGAIQEYVTNKRYFRTFCDKFVEAFVLRFAGNLWRCKPIGEIGAEQMLLDTQAVKTLLIELPTMGLDLPTPTPAAAAAAAPATFVRFVQRGLGKVETILKTTMRPHEPVEMFIDHYFLLIGDRHQGNFQRILELKGLKRSEQQPMMDLFQRKQVDMDNLQDNAPVMSVLQGLPSQPASTVGQGMMAGGLVGNMASLLQGAGANPGGQGGSGGGGQHGGTYQQIGNLLSHSPFSGLTGSPGGGGSGTHRLSTSDDAQQRVSSERDAGGAASGANNGQGSGGAAGGGPTSAAGAFATSARLNANLRKLVAGMRAKKDNQEAP
ncbi:Vacuolar protein sorting-associated protein 53 [Actinomortierella ambigua]|nr:Vacuolar protein sorting-associated protein 53 [Actinomortierella ambigua]